MTTQTTTREAEMIRLLGEYRQFAQAAATALDPSPDGCECDDRCECPTPAPDPATGQAYAALAQAAATAFGGFAALEAVERQRTAA